MALIKSKNVRSKIFNKFLYGAFLYILTVIKLVYI